MILNILWRIRVPRAKRYNDLILFKPSSERGKASIGLSVATRWFLTNPMCFCKVHRLRKQQIIPLYLNSSSDMVPCRYNAEINLTCLYLKPQSVKSPTTHETLFKICMHQNLHAPNILLERLLLWSIVTSFGKHQRKPLTFAFSLYVKRPICNVICSQN